jgi:hypothetical protein
MIKLFEYQTESSGNPLNTAFPVKKPVARLPSNACLPGEKNP